MKTNCKVTQKQKQALNHENAEKVAAVPPSAQVINPRNHLALEVKQPPAWGHSGGPARLS